MIEPSPQKRIVKDLPLTRLLPNMLTLLSLCSGLTGIRFAVHMQWDHAVIAIVFAAVFDILDGRVARMLNIVSKFGAELDSLSDAISFGVAPGFIMYEWTLKNTGGFGWIAVLIFAVCGTLRLARFNTLLDYDLPLWAKHYFIGIPIPAAAFLSLLPLTLFLEYGDSVTIPPALSALWLVVVGGLMISQLPTLALKGWRVAPAWVAPIFIGAVVVTAGLITYTWITLSALEMLYILALPLGWISYRNRRKKEKSL